MHKHVLRAIEDIEIFPLISLVIFTVFFIGLIFYAVKLSKGLVDHMGQLPLDEDAVPTSHTNQPTL